MKLLNLGCGGPDRLGDPWVNLDDLHAQFPKGTPERAQLDGEPNYVNHDIASGPLPFDAESFDGVLASHVIEHFDAQAGAKLMQNCHHILKRGGVLLVSVPDASYFRRVYAEDCNENWPRLYEVTDPANPIPTFFEAALWFDQHKVLLTEDSLWCYFVRAGFKPHRVYRISTIAWELPETPSALELMRAVVNRRRFSLVMSGVRT